MPGLPPPIDDEREQLLVFLTQQRDGIRNAAFGLTDEQARLTPTAGSLSIGGLVKHCAAVERSWMGTMSQTPRDPESQDADYEAGFTLADDETLVGALGDYSEASAATDRALRKNDLDAAVPVPKGVSWFPDDVEAWSVRWVLLHLIQETARHAGHADIVRETIDGATMYELMAGAESWPATDWLTPWSPKT
ncbi:MAG: DinB family protein [Acidimicrobiia bacterium]